MVGRARKHQEGNSGGEIIIYQWFLKLRKRQQVALCVLASICSMALGLEIIALSFHIGFAPIRFLLGSIGLMIAFVPTALLEISLAVWVFWQTYHFIIEKF